MTRTDIHRVSQIIPADYSYVLCYSLATVQDGWPVPSFGINCALDRRVTDDTGALVTAGAHDDDGRCCVVGLRQRFTGHCGGPGKCTVCGTNHIYGEVWQHNNGDFIYVGHICAAKYGLLAEDGEFQNARAIVVERAIRAAEKAERAEAAAKFIAEHDGLAEAFTVDHHIIADIRRKLEQYGEISDKQIAFVLKLAGEARNPEPAEPTVSAPIESGRQVIEGEVISCKWHESIYGGSSKITVKVRTPAGYWLAWGTCPGSLDGNPKGRTVQFTAALKRGRDAHFALFSRPTKAAYVDQAAA